MNKRGQVTIFVIVAVVIVSIVLVMFVFPKMGFFVEDIEPNSYLKKCIEPNTQEILRLVVQSGGYAEPTNYLEYEGNKIQYLCYTAENYKPCLIQQPLLVNHVEGEIKKFVEPKAKECLQNLKNEYEGNGYSVQASPGELNVELVPGSVDVEFISEMTLTKERTQTFEKFDVEVETEIYDLLMTSMSILDFESTLGDSGTEFYMNYYPDLRIEKTRLDNGTVYELSNVITKDEFKFATRSLVWPPGYGMI
ncbi:MAG: hypothetical protein QF460_02850 [Candidatus Nanoarchaeia archaeon]|nr:hypothetical protein [Candidatus Nanoarchaeia archaeon]